MPRFSIKRLFVSMTLWAVAAAMFATAITPWAFHFAFLPFLLWNASGIFWGVGIGVLTDRIWWGALMGVVTMYLTHGIAYDLAFHH